MICSPSVANKSNITILPLRKDNQSAAYLRDLALYLATQDDDLDKFNTALEAGADIEFKYAEKILEYKDIKMGYKNSALHLACIRGFIPIVLKLIELNANVNIQNGDNFIPLHAASIDGHVEVARVLLDNGANPHAKNSLGDTPLAWASNRGHLEMSRLLLDRGSDPDAADRYKWTPLHNASFKGQVEVARLLLDRGANKEAKTSVGGTPLHYAARDGFIYVVQLFLEVGADINAQTIEGDTALHWAAGQGHLEIAQLLLKKGADPLVKGQLDQIPQQKVSPYKSDLYRLLCMHGKPSSHDSLSMAMLMLEDLAVYHFLDCSSIIELYQMMGTN